jgi:mRNA-degrading endonuclease RelE of RelBE toxin-antitoxin system
MREVVFSPAAARQYKKLPAHARSLIKSRVSELLGGEDATEETRNRFRLRRQSLHADYELLVEPWRLYYRVRGDLVVVELIGRKEGNRLFIEGKEFRL